MIQMHRLEGFYWVATAKGYTAAARAFPYPITQPAVYQQVCAPFWNDFYLRKRKSFRILDLFCDNEGINAA